MDPPSVGLAIREFSVRAIDADGQSYFLPRLTVAETTGSGDATITKIRFELIDRFPGFAPNSPVDRRPGRMGQSPSTMATTTTGPRSRVLLTLRACRC